MLINASRINQRARIWQSEFHFLQMHVKSKLLHVLKRFWEIPVQNVTCRRIHGAAFSSLETYSNRV